MTEQEFIEATMQTGIDVKEEQKKYEEWLNSQEASGK